MSDLGVRTAARKEAEQYLCGDEFCEGCLERRIGFEDGAVWAAGRLPTRDEIALAIAAKHWEEDSGDVETWANLTPEERENVMENYMTLRAADAVLALIQSRMEDQ